MSAAGESDAEEGEIVDDEDEAEEAADDKHTTSTTSTTQQHSSKSTSCDKNKKSGSKSGRDSSSRKSSGSSGRKRQKESDGDADRAKRARESEESDSSSGGDDEPATKQRLMMQMMQIMLNASKQGKKSDRKTIELMDKMIKRGSDVSAKEVRDMVRKNKRLLRTGSRDRRSRSRSRDRRSRSRRPDPDDHKSKFPRNQSPDRVVASGLLVDPRTGVGLLKEKCKFFAEGKCHKGFECPFSHEIVLTKKREICKFYLQGYCGKGEHCFFMHEEFPCKFFHTGADCYSGDKCRFSHQPLTEEGRSILRGYLDSGELPDDHIRNRQAEIAAEADVSSDPAAAVSNQVAAATPPATTTYQPVKPVPKRHAILGDVTDAMRTSYYTWMWQQELKELEMAYTGNKRNLFCVEKQFIVAEKPETPPPEDPDEAEFKVFSFYTDTIGDVDIRQFQPPPVSIEADELAQLQQPDDDDLFLMSAAHDEDLRIPPPNHRPEAVVDSVQTGAVTNVPEMDPEKDWTPVPEADTQPEQFETARDGGGDSPSGQPESRSKPKYDIAKMLNVIRQSTNQSNSAAPAVPGHSEFWQNIFSGTSFAVGSSPTSSSPAQMSPSQVKDPRLKKEQRQEDAASALQKQSSVEQDCESSEFRLVAVTAPGIDYSDYVSLYHTDCKLKNDPRLQKFFTRSSSLDQLLPPETSSKSFTSSTITQSTLASLMSTSSNHTASPVKFAQDQDDRLTPTSPPHLPALPPLTLNQPKPLLSLVPPPPPAMTPLELMTSKPLRPAAPPQLSLHSYADQDREPQRDAENGDNAAMDLSAKKVIIETEDDTPASPASRRSSCDADAILSPPLIQTAVDDATDADVKNVFGSMDPAASPFC